MKIKTYAAKFVLFIVAFLGFNIVWACDGTSVSLVSSYQNSTTGENFYTVEVCLGLEPNWGYTSGFTLDGDVNITSTTTTSITSTYEYCSVELSFRGEGCAVTAMGQPPAGGTLETANVTATASTGGGNLSYNGGTCDGCWLAPNDNNIVCAECSNPSQLCWNISFTTGTDVLTTLNLLGTEDGNCPDETITIASPPVCTPPEIVAEVNGGSSVTVCEGDAIDLDNSSCTGCGGGISYQWSGPDGYSSTSSNPGSFTATASSGGTYSVYAEDGPCVGPSTSISVTIDALPTGTLGQTTAEDCNSVDVPITFTGDSPWTFTYEIDGTPTTVTTSDNPYLVTVSGTSTVSFGSGVTNSTCAGSGTASGTTDVTISPVDSDAGTDFSPDPSTDYTIDATGTAGLDGYDTTITLQSTTSTEGGTFANNDPTGVDATDIDISDLGLTCTNLSLANIPDNPVCFSYSDSRASNITAELCFGGNCITVAEGNVGNSPYCFEKGDVYNLLDGESCTTGSFSLNVADVVDGNGPNGKDGTLDSWTVELNEVVTTLKDNPSYSWVASSGDADTNFLSSTSVEDPVFNAPGGTGAGCYELTTTDGQGCTSIDIVCFSAITLDVDLLKFNAIVQDNHSIELDWEPSSFKETDQFYVERSETGKNFEQISGQVEPSENFEYRYNDSEPNDISYYRLRRENEYGETDYSDVRKVLLKEAGHLDIINIYPQPTAGDYVNIVFSSGVDQNVDLEFYDAQGRVISKETTLIHQGVSTNKVSTADFKSGIYSVVVTSGHTRIATKLRKL